MISIQNLFEDLDSESVPKKYRKRISKKCKILKGFEESIPDLSYPKIGTARFEEDIAEVRRCVREPSLSKSFLKLSNKNSESVFRKFLKESKFEWSTLDDVLEELDGVLLRLKFKYRRSRPIEYFEENGEEIKTKTAHSPSFPSGHTAFAYFLCDVLSDMYPEKQMSLQTLAEMIGQSRIENGVHFPSDVSAGRLIGEMAAKYFLNNKSINESNIDKSAQKVFVRFLREKAKSTRSSFSKEKALNCFVNDMAVFVSECCNLSINDSYNSCKTLVEGYPLSECDKEAQSLFEGMMFVFFNNLTTTSDIVELHRLVEKRTILRDFKKSTISGITYAPPERINELVEKVSNLNKKPFLKMATLSWISPFSIGNEKITNLIFLKETGFNFDITNQVITDELDYMLENFYLANNMENILS